MIRNIIREKYSKMNELNKNTENSIREILEKHLNDFEKITVHCNNYNDTVCLSKDNKVLRLKISYIPYNNGSYVRGDNGRVQSSFTKKEIKDIIDRLNKIFKGEIK